MPGSSEWCERHCYAKRGHFQFWIDQYGEPIDMPHRLASFVRLHSCGDFDSPEYVRWTIDIAEENPKTEFWAYTRSWRDDDIRPVLRELRELDNFTLFASMDPSIKENPPEGWRVAWVETDDRAEGTFCPNDKGIAENCRECGLCFGESESDIIFKKK